MGAVKGAEVGTGFVDGVVDGIAEGILDGTTEGILDGTLDGTAESAFVGPAPMRIVVDPDNIFSTSTK